MTGSAYHKTALPAKLDLTKYNTREQLKAPAGDKAKSSTSGAAEDSRADCNEVMAKDLRAWLVKQDITGPPPNPVAEQKAMWSWIRDFHQEYNEDWFARNMPRLHGEFKPIFVKEMKAMKAAAKAAGTDAAGAAGADMLDFGDSTGAAAPVAASSSGMDLLDMGGPADPTPAPASSTQAASLLDFDMACPASGSAPAAGGYAVPSQPAAAAPSGDLLSMMGTDLSMPSTSTAQPAAPSSGLAGLDFGDSGLAGLVQSQPAQAAALDPFGALAAPAPAVASVPVTAPAPAMAPAAAVDLDPFASLCGLSGAAPATAPSPPQTSSAPKEPNLLDLM